MRATGSVYGVAAELHAECGAPGRKVLESGRVSVAGMPPLAGTSTQWRLEGKSIPGSWCEWIPPAAERTSIKHLSNKAIINSFDTTVMSAVEQSWPNQTRWN